MKEIINKLTPYTIFNYLFHGILITGISNVIPERDSFNIRPTPLDATGTGAAELRNLPRSEVLVQRFYRVRVPQLLINMCIWNSLPRQLLLPRRQICNAV